MNDSEKLGRALQLVEEVRTKESTPYEAFDYLTIAGDHIKAASEELSEAVANA